MKNDLEKMKNDYLNSGANYCPFCSSNDIVAGEANFDDTSAWRDVKCKNCKMQWVEHFMMVDVEFDDSVENLENRCDQDEKK